MATSQTTSIGLATTPPFYTLPDAERKNGNFMFSTVRYLREAEGSIHTCGKIAIVTGIALSCLLGVGILLTGFAINEYVRQKKIWTCHTTTQHKSNKLLELKEIQVERDECEKLKSNWKARNQKREEKRLVVQAKIRGMQASELSELLQQSVNSLDFETPNTEVIFNFKNDSPLKKWVFRIAYNGKVDAFVIGLLAVYKGERIRMPIDENLKQILEYTIYKTTKEGVEEYNLHQECFYEKGVQLETFQVPEIEKREDGKNSLMTRDIEWEDNAYESIQAVGFSTLQRSSHLKKNFLKTNSDSAFFLKPGETFRIEFPPESLISPVEVGIDFSPEEIDK